MHPTQLRNQNPMTPGEPRGVAQAVRTFGDVLDTSLGLVANVLTGVDRLVGDVRRDSAEVARQSEKLYAACADTIASARGAARATPRFLRIVKQGVTIAARYRLFHKLHADRISGTLQRRPPGSFLLERPDDRAQRRLDRIHALSAEQLYHLCVELRGGVLKLGQFASCRMDILPAVYIEQLARLRDQVPTVDSDAICARIERELGAPIDELFASFDPEPIAAASLAQVHGAVLHDGTDVVIKVQTPGIENIIETDIAALGVLAQLVGDLVPGIDVFADELSRSIRRELDFCAEARHARGFVERFAGDDRVAIPAVIEAYSTSRVLTMTRMRGRRLTEYLDDCQQRGDTAERDRLLTVLIDCTCRQILDHGVFHADPHPGNFLVGQRGELIVLDFGSVAELSTSERRGYAELATAIVAGARTRVAALLDQIGFSTATGTSEPLVDVAAMLLDGFREDQAIDWTAIDPKRELRRFIAIVRRHPVVSVPENFVLLGRVLAALGGLVWHYQPDVRLFAIIAPHLASALRADPHVPSPTPH